MVRNGYRRQACLLACLVALAACDDPTATPGDVPGARNTSTGAVEYQVTLRTHGGQYVQANNGGGHWVSAMGTTQGDWEKLTLVDVNGGSLESGDPVHLKSTLIPRYFTALNGGGGEIWATAQSAGAYETFTILRAGGSGSIGDGAAIALRAANGQYLQAFNGGGQQFWAEGGSIFSWTTLTLQFIGTAPPSGPPAGGTRFYAWSNDLGDISNPHGIPLIVFHNGSSNLHPALDRLNVEADLCLANGYTPVETVYPNLVQFARDNPGKTYVIGDEPDNHTLCGGQNPSPEQYADIAYQVASVIKQADGSAKISTAGFSVIGWTDYARRFFNAYNAKAGAPPIAEVRFNVFAMHPDAGSVAGWKARVDTAVAFAQSRNVEFVMGSFGVPYDLSPADWAMTEMVGYLKGRTKAAYWWRYDEENWCMVSQPLPDCAHALTLDGALTADGVKFKQLTQ